MIQPKMKLRGHSMLHLKGHLRFCFTEHLKLHNKVEVKDVFDDEVYGPLDRAIESAPEGSPKGATKDAFVDLHKDTEEDAFEVALKTALEVALKSHLRLQLRVHLSFICWCTH